MVKLEEVALIVPLTFSKFPPVKVRLEDVDRGLVPLPNKISLAVILAEPVPPLATESWPVHPRVRLLLAIEPVTLVSLVTKPTRVEPRVEELVPPLATGRIPVTFVVKSIVLLVISPLTISDEDNNPADEL